MWRDALPFLICAVIVTHLILRARRPRCIKCGRVLARDERAAGACHACVSPAVDRLLADMRAALETPDVEGMLAFLDDE